MNKSVVLLLVIFLPLLAVWQNPTPIYVGPGDQTIDVVISDGEGGAAVIWWDGVTEWNYMQVIDSAGNLKWDPEGVPIIANGSIATQNPDVFQDTEGNYWVALEGNEDIYLQKLSPTGQRLFGDGGVAVCTAEGEQSRPYICYSENAAITVWKDARETRPIYPYTQRVSQNGSVLWEANGIKITEAEYGPVARCVPDGHGGAFYIFRRVLDSENYVAGQRIDSSGSRLWGDSGIYYGKGLLGCSPGFFCGHMIKDEEDGFIFFYFTNEWEAKAQRVDSLGNVLWDMSGIVLDTHFTTGVSPVAANGLFVVGGTTVSNPHEAVYCNRLLLDGSTPWGNASITVWDEWAYDPRETIVPSVTEDGIVAWRDVYDAGDPYGDRYEEQGIMAQRVDNEGNILWPEEVHVVGTQGVSPQVTGTFDKSGIIAWNDNRNGNVDLYATRIDSLGNLPPGIEEAPYEIASPLQVELVGGNIVSSSANLRYSVDQNAFVSAAVFDVTGCLVKTLESRYVNGGAYDLIWNGYDDAGSRVSTGVYFIQVTALNRAVSKKVVFIK